MAKQMSKGGKRFLSLIFHIVVLVIMVTAYDTARALINKNVAGEASDKTKADAKKDSSAKPTNKKDSIKPASKSTITPVGKSTGTSTSSPGTGTGKMIGNKLSDTKGKMEERGTSMEDLMAEKKRKEEKKAAEEAAKKAAEKTE